MYYALLDDTGYCIGISEAADNIEQGNMIEISSFEGNYLNCLYDRHTGKWTQQYRMTPQTGEEIDIQTVFENQIALMEAMADDYEKQEEYKINQMEMLASIYECNVSILEGQGA